MRYEQRFGKIGRNRSTAPRSPPGANPQARQRQQSQAPTRPRWFREGTRTSLFWPFPTDSLGRMSFVLLFFLAVSALSGLMVGFITGFSESTVSALWSRARLPGKVLFVIVFPLVCMAPFTVALAAPFYFFHDFLLAAAEISALAYCILLGCLWIGILGGRRLSARRRHNAP